MKEAHKSKLADSMRDLIEDDPQLKDKDKEMVTGFHFFTKSLGEERLLFSHLQQVQSKRNTKEDMDRGSERNPVGSQHPT